jgi:hypothetical protein
MTMPRTTGIGAVLLGLVVALVGLSGPASAGGGGGGGGGKVWNTAAWPLPPDLTRTQQTDKTFTGTTDTDVVTETAEFDALYVDQKHCTIVVIHHNPREYLCGGKTLILHFAYTDKPGGGLLDWVTGTLA